MAKRLDSIKRDKVNWVNDDAGINVDEELDEEEIGMRLTKLTPDQRRGDRGQRGSGQDRRGGRSAGRPRRENFEQDNNRGDDQQRDQAPPRQRKQEKFNGGKMEDFPEF